MAWYRRWRNVFRDGALSSELDAELAYHLAETADRLIEAGMPEAEALIAARRQLGNYTIRLKLLPVKDPAQLAVVDWNKDSARAGAWSTRSANFTYTQWNVLRAQGKPFSDMIAWSASQFDLTSGGEPRFAQGVYVSGSFFPAFGVGAELGRTLSTSDDNAVCNAAAVISDCFWHREFGGDPHVLGRKLILHGYPVSVIGVTPPSFFGVEVGHRYEVAIPLCADRLLADDHKGRIPPRGLVALDHGAFKTGLDSQERQRILAGLVLLIACANLANLLLARATVREPEIAYGSRWVLRGGEW